jgi:ribosomal protein S21
MCVVTVINNDLDKALRNFKRCMQRCGTLRDFKERRFYEKPCQERLRLEKERRLNLKKMVKNRKRKFGY